MLWIDGTVPFPFGKDGSGVFDNCFLYGSEVTIFFAAGSAGHFACSLLALAAPTSRPLLLSSYLTLVLFSPPCLLLHCSSYLNLFGRSGRNCLFSPTVLSGSNGSSDIRFSRETTWQRSWPDGEHYSCPLQSLVVSLLLYLVSILLFSRTGGVLSHRNSSTHSFSRFPPKNLCFFVTVAVFSRLHCNGHCLLFRFLSL